MSALSEESEKDVLPWLKLAEDLRRLKLDVELKMPQICVMGDQSSGKSSVLEALSGIPFPRGSGLVTRCPIRMVMKRATGSEVWSAKVSTSLDSRPRVVHDIEELSRTMDSLMRELCTGTNTFSTESVIIELVSPDAFDLTVVDLPGIIRTVTAGQNVTVIEQVNRLIKSFLVDKRTIILAVVPANQDIATVDILERAQSVDPKGERTIGVLTKTDLIGPGNEEEVISVVNNVRKPLALGYVMVRNRSQKEIAENISTAKARDIEHTFFSTHPSFRTCSSKLYGVTQLSKKLTSLLVARIKQELFPMKNTVERSLIDIRTQLRALPANINTAKTAADRQKLLVSTVQEYSRLLTDSIRGEYRDRVLVKHANLRMFTLVLKKFEYFKAQVSDTAPPFSDPAFITQLAGQIDQLRGRELPGFMSSQAFYMSMSQCVEKWSQPLQAMVEEVRDSALRVCLELSAVLLSQYPGMRSVLRSEIETILNDMTAVALVKLEDGLLREQDPFTLNEFLEQWVNKIRFDRFSAAVDKCFEDSNKGGQVRWTELKEDIFIGMSDWYRRTHAVSPESSALDMSGIMEAYWHLSAKRFVDSSCMMTDRELLGRLPGAVQDAMYKHIKDDTLLQNCFTESPELLQRKHDLETRRDALLQASVKLAGISVSLAPTNSANPTPSTDVPAADSAVTATVGQISQQLSFVVPLGEHGIGLVLLSDSGDPLSSSTATTIRAKTTTTQPNTFVGVKGFREMPAGVANPSKAAGLLPGDRIVGINGNLPSNPTDAVALMKKAKGSVRLDVIRIVNG